MAKRLKAGDTIPAFSYDTPYEPQKSFYELLNGEHPVLMVFFPNFGHPITRHFITQYLDTIYALRSVRLVCVVRSKPETIAKAAPKGSLPFELICDAEGVLYDYFQIPQKHGMLRCYSLEGMRIIKQARQQGYAPAKNEPHQMPLTLVVGEGGKVLFAHYGHSVTDLPADCSAMERVAQELRLPAQEKPAQQQAEPARETVLNGFEPADQGALSAEELMAALEENKTFEQQDAAAPKADRPEQESAPATNPQTDWTPAPESDVYPPEEKPCPPQEPTEIPQQPQEPEEPLASIWRGKMIYSPDHVPVKVDFSALGFGEEEKK